MEARFIVAIIVLVTVCKSEFTSHVRALGIVLYLPFNLKPQRDGLAIP